MKPMHPAYVCVKDARSVKPMHPAYVCVKEARSVKPMHPALEALVEEQGSNEHKHLVRRRKYACVGSFS